MTERYSTEQVQQILALAMQQREEGFSRSQLEEMAMDLGITSSDLTQAEQSWQALSTSTSPVPGHVSERQRFHQQLKTYAAVNTFLLILNFILSGTITWAIYPLLGWGLGLLLPKKAFSCKNAK